MQARDRLPKQQKSLNMVWVSVSLCLWTMLSTLPYLNQSNELCLATICSDESKSSILFDIEGQPIKSKTWCLDCIVQVFMAEPSFSIADLILNERKATYDALKADSEKPQAVQHYFQTGPPEIM